MDIFYFVHNLRYS